MAADDRLDLQNAAEQGDADAQFYMGLLYLKGQGVPRDWAKATEWFGKITGAMHDKMKSILIDKTFYLNGQKYYICRGIPTPNPERSIYLFGTVDEQHSDFSLWFISYKDEGDTINLWPYEGEGSSELMHYLMDEFVEHAYDDD